MIFGYYTICTIIYTTFSTTAMESIELTEDRWISPKSSDILSKSWATLPEAKKAAKIWILDRGESWAPTDQNNKRRLQLHCLLTTCAFKPRVAQKKDFFGVISYTPHDCPPSTHAKFKQPHSAWYLASLLERDININRQIKPKEIRERANLYHQLPHLPYQPAWRARERLRDQVNGDESIAFSLIPVWINRVKTADNSTYIELKKTHDNRFEALFIMLGSIRSRLVISSFLLINIVTPYFRLRLLRPFYTLDSTHTRSQYNLTLLIIVGIDSEDRVLPLAWILVPSENETWWTWFCERLREAFKNTFHPETLIISDREKGLFNAVKSELPYAYHAMCCQNIAENIHKKIGWQYKAIFWRITRTAHQPTFDSLIETLERDSPRVVEYISLIGYNNFTFLHFPVPRFGHDTSNIVKSTNSMWREIRELPPLQLLNGIYKWFLTTWYQRGQTQLLLGNSILSNAAYQGYKHRESIARSFRVLPSSDTYSLVSTFRASQLIVTLPPVTTNPADQYEGTCSCGKYSDYHAPCSHTIAYIIYLGRDPFCYFNQRYRWETSQWIYNYPVPPITIQGLRVLDQDNLLRPPIKKAKRGRPNIARIRTTQEETRVYNCSICRQPGHIRRIYPNQPVEHGRAQRV
jgi:hypothetical protein